jgi:hypothetical protein
MNKLSALVACNNPPVLAAACYANLHQMVGVCHWRSATEQASLAYADRLDKLGHTTHTSRDPLPSSARSRHQQDLQTPLAEMLKAASAATAYLTPPPAAGSAPISQCQPSVPSPQVVGAQPYP